MRSWSEGLKTINSVIFSSRQKYMYFSWVSVKGNSRENSILLHQIDSRQQRIDYCYCSSCSLMLLSGVLSGWVCKQASMLALQSKCFSICWKILEEIEQGVLGVWLTSLAQGLKFICLQIGTCLKVHIVRMCLYCQWNTCRREKCVLPYVV